MATTTHIPPNHRLPLMLLLALVLCFLAVAAMAQDSTDNRPLWPEPIVARSYAPPQWQWKKAAWVAGISFAGGTINGSHEMWHYHKADARRIFGDPQKWDPDETWRNKWKNGDPDQGERFPLSSTTLVMFTDPNHAAKWGNHTALFATGIIIGVGTFDGWKHRNRRERWTQVKHAVGYGAVAYTFRAAGFHTVYTLLPTVIR